MKDYLNRTEDKDRIVKLIKSANVNKQNLSFAINAKWGAGKSYFIKMVIEDIKDDCHIFYYDSWDNDYYEDPLVGMLDCIKDELNKINSRKKALDVSKRRIFEKVFNAVTSYLDNLVENKTGIRPFNSLKKVKQFIKECYEEAEISGDFNEYDKIKLAKHLIICSLNKLSQIKPIVFIVDELDRCLPTYALKIIERIHHVSENVQNCVTMFAVDTNQLEKIIDTLYRFEKNSVDAKGYLRKVIDFSYDLGNGLLSEDFRESLINYKNLFSNRTTWIEQRDIDSFIDELFNNIEMRTVEKIVNNSMKAHCLMTAEKTYEQDLMCFELFITWALMEYGDSYLEQISKVLVSDVKTDKSFLLYLITRSDHYFVSYYDKAYEVYRVPILDLKSLVVYYVLSTTKKYHPSFTVPGRNIPQYLTRYLNDFSDILKKIQC